MLSKVRCITLSLLQTEWKENTSWYVGADATDGLLFQFPPQSIPGALELDVMASVLGWAGYYIPKVHHSSRSSASVYSDAKCFS